MISNNLKLIIATSCAPCFQYLPIPMAFILECYWDSHMLGTKPNDKVASVCPVHVVMEPLVPVHVQYVPPTELFVFAVEHVCMDEVYVVLPCDNFQCRDNVY